MVQRGPGRRLRCTCPTWRRGSPVRFVWGGSLCDPPLPDALSGTNATRLSPRVQPPARSTAEVLSTQSGICKLKMDSKEEGDRRHAMTPGSNSDTVSTCTCLEFVCLLQIRS